jgi:hypothetical protein
LYWVHLDWEGFKLTTLVVIGNDCIWPWPWPWRPLHDNGIKQPCVISLICKSWWFI